MIARSPKGSPQPFSGPALIPRARAIEHHRPFAPKREPGGLDVLLPGLTVRVDEQQVILRKCGPKGGETTTAAESVEQGRDARAEEEREWNEEYIPACCIDRPANREGCSNETPKAGQTLLSREEKLLDSRKAVPPNVPA